MTLEYQRVTLAPPAPVGPPAPIPADLFGLEDSSLADIPAAIGVAAATELGYLNTGFTPIPDPPPAPPVLVATNSQTRIALLNASLLDDVETAVGTLPQADQIAWVYNSIFQTDSPVIVAAAASVGISQPTLVAVFTAAASIPT